MLKFSEKIKLENNDALMRFKISKLGRYFEVLVKVDKAGAEKINHAYENNELINLEEIGEILEYNPI